MSLTSSAAGCLRADLLQFRHGRHHLARPGVPTPRAFPSRRRRAFISTRPVSLRSIGAMATPSALSSPPTIEQVTQALAGVSDPEIHRPITELGMVKNVDVGPDGTVRVDVWLTVAGCPLRDTITRDVTAAVSKLGGVTRVRVELDVMSEEQRQELQTTAARRAARARDPVRPARLADQGVRGGQRQGRRRQVVGDGEPGRGTGRGRAEGRPARRRHLRPLGAADARRDRAADPGRADDHAAVGARRAAPSPAG